jgi:TolB protein
MLGSCGAERTIVAPSASVPASDGAPAWSPDGTRIAYAHSSGTAESADRAGVYVVGADGGMPEQILGGSFGFPDWSPDGRRLVVTDRGRTGWHAGLATVTASGESLSWLTLAPGYAATWSPDGRAIAFQTYDASNVYRLWRMASDGSQLQMMNPSGDEGWFEPHWSPDGSRILHVRSGPGIGPPSLFVMDADGHDAHRLTDDGFEARYPAWSPDGEWIVWGSWHGRNPELWVMKADGSAARRIANGYWPDWAPDSRRIAYIAADTWDGAYRLFTIDVETSEIRQITR